LRRVSGVKVPRKLARNGDSLPRTRAISMTCL
jgi:hypothetical protein